MMRKVIIGLALLCAVVPAGAQRWSASSNVADLARLGTLNAEVSYSVARHWSIAAGAKYNPFTYGGSGADRFQSRQRLFNISGRFWPWHVWSGWWMAGKLQYQEYNRGGLRGPETEEGDRLGGALSGGFAYMLTPHVNLDFGFGLWTGYSKSVTYACPECGRKLSENSGIFILPDDILVSVALIF